MDKTHVNAEWILNQLTSARWHLDRAAGVGADTVRQEVGRARAISENLARVLPSVTLDSEQRRRVQAELSELQKRLRAMESGGAD